MLLSIALGALGALITVGVGVPLAVRLSRVHVWRRTAPADAFRERTVMAKRNFEPLDFGPVLMQWPSENPRPRLAFPEAPWPSESWDDPAFGRPPSQRADPSPVEAASQVQPQKPAKKKQKAKQHKVRKQTRQKQAAQQKAAPAPQQRRPRAPVDRSPPRQPPRAPRKQASAPKPAGRPDRAELERMIDSLGLAGTVQHLMQENGWDFKTAATWLARTRQG